MVTATIFPDTGYKKVIDEISFRRAIEYAILRGLTIQQIATRMETSPESVDRWRRGEKLPHPDYINAATKVIDQM